MQNVAQSSLIKCCCRLQNVRVTPFNISELLRENQQGVKLPPTPTHTHTHTHTHTQRLGLINNVLKELAKSVLIPLVLT